MAAVSDGFFFLSEADMMLDRLLGIRPAAFQFHFVRRILAVTAM